jgi:hypothetical protein
MVNLAVMIFRQIFLLFIALSSVYAGDKHEAYYHKIAAEDLNVEMEVTMPDKSRCDIVTEDYAIEVERADNWKESIGQALNYAFQSNKKAGIVLFVDKSTDPIRLMSVIEHYELPIEL